MGKPRVQMLSFYRNRNAEQRQLFCAKQEFVKRLGARERSVICTDRKARMPGSFCLIRSRQRDVSSTHVVSPEAIFWTASAMVVLKNGIKHRLTLDV